MKSWKFIWILGLALIIVLAFGYSQVTKKKAASSLTSESTQKFDSYGFNGTIQTLGSNTLKIKGVIVRHVGSETKAVSEDRTYSTNSATKFLKMTNQGNKDLKFSDLKVGDNVNVITKQNFFNQDNLLAEEVDLIAN